MYRDDIRTKEVAIQGYIKVQTETIEQFLLVAIEFGLSRCG
jgi:hypothetical protein